MIEILNLTPPRGGFRPGQYLTGTIRLISRRGEVPIKVKVLRTAKEQVMVRVGGREVQVDYSYKWHVWQARL